MSDERVVGVRDAQLDEMPERVDAPVKCQPPRRGMIFKAPAGGKTVTAKVIGKDATGRWMVTIVDDAGAPVGNEFCLITKAWIEEQRLGRAEIVDPGDMSDDSYGKPPFSSEEMYRLG